MFKEKSTRWDIHTDMSEQELTMNEKKQLFRIASQHVDMTLSELSLLSGVSTKRIIEILGLENIPLLAELKTGELKLACAYALSLLKKKDVNEFLPDVFVMSPIEFINSVHSKIREYGPGGVE